MDILTQYFNRYGQIISRTPDLTTRGFYRDVMCRHRFNEMFVAAQERNRIGYYINNDESVIVCGDGESCDTPYIDGPSISWGDKVRIDLSYIFRRFNGYTFVHGTDSGNGNGGIRVTHSLDTTIADSNIRLGCIIKSPYGLITGKYSDSEEIAFGVINGETTIAACYMQFSIDSISCGCYLNDGSFYYNNYSDWNYDSNYNKISGWPASLSDGSINLIDFFVDSKEVHFYMNGYEFKSLDHNCTINTSQLSSLKTMVQLNSHYGDFCGQEADHPSESRLAVSLSYVK